MIDRADGEHAKSKGIHRGLARGVRWFAAEFLVVVCGVLVALALNAYYQNRTDSNRESGYIDQLATDLVESETRLEEALARNRDEIDKLTTLLDLFGETELPTLEQFDELKVLSFQPAEPTLSTAHAVVETGDLQLIEDDAMRKAIIQFVGDGEAFIEGQDAIGWDWLARGIRDYYAFVRPGLGPDHELGVSPDEALSQEALYDTAFDLRLGYSNLIRHQQAMLETVQGMQAEVKRVNDEVASPSG